MSLRYTNPHHITPNTLQQNAGPKRGYGKVEISAVDRLTHGKKTSGPKRGTGKAPDITPPVYQSIKPSTTVKRPIRNEQVPIPIQKPHHIDFTQNLMPHEGPKRGIGICDPIMFFSNPTAGPRKGHGPIPGIDPKYTYESGGTKDEQLCVHLTNEFRKSQGKPPLKLCRELCDIAMPHTKNMLAQTVPFGHQGFHERAKKAAGFRGAGENVAWNAGYSDPIRTMVEGWIKSPGHRANMLGNYTHIGVAFAHEGSKWYGTQFFGLM